jgi:UPF0755 protein
MLAFLTAGLLSCSVLEARFDQPADETDDTRVVFEVPKGATARSIGPRLEQGRFVSSGLEWRLFLKIRKTGNCLKAGRFEISRSMSLPQIMSALCGVPLSDSESFTVVEGWRIREIDLALTERGWTTPGEYSRAANNPGRFKLPDGLAGVETLEGLLFPDTYQVEPDRFDVSRFIQRQINALQGRFVEPSDTAVHTRGLYPLIIMASLLQREEPKAENMPLVAGVLWKRLDNKWNLGVDATSRYTLEVWNERRAFLKMLRDPNDVYNTRLRPGLPPTPIGNPGIDALEAALSSTESAYWYYLHDSTGQIHLSRSAKEHEAFRKRYNVY